MAKIIQFPLRKAVPGAVYCPPLRLTFPKLHRGHATATTADLRAHGLGPDDAEPADWVMYDLEPGLMPVVGTVDRQEIDHILAADQAESLLIRHLDERKGFEDGALHGL